MLEPMSLDSRREDNHARTSFARVFHRSRELADSYPRSVVVDRRIAHRDQFNAFAWTFGGNVLSHRTSPRFLRVQIGRDLQQLGNRAIALIYSRRKEYA